MTRVLAAAVLVGAAGCSSLQPVVEPARFITETNPQVVFVTHRNRAILAIEHPRLSGDTVHGTWAGQDRPLKVALSQIQSVQAVQRDGRRTFMLIGGVAVLTGVAVYAFVQNANGQNDWYCDYNSAVPRCG